MASSSTSTRCSISSFGTAEDPEFRREDAGISMERQVSTLGTPVYRSPTAEVEGGEPSDMKENAQRIYARTYAKIVAGRPRKMHFDVATKAFELCFTQESTEVVTSPLSEIFVPFQWQYPHGIDIRTTPNVEVAAVNADQNQVLIRNRAVSATDVSEACVTITPKAAPK
eukprot:gene6119-4395_t